MLLRRIPLSFELTNGHLEKEIKILLAAALRGAANAEHEIYLSVRDKSFNDAEIDLLALKAAGEGGPWEPAFWAELKCNFLEAGVEAAFDVATEALAQVSRYSEKLSALPKATIFREQILACPVYIVHFLNSMPDRNCGLPVVITKKFRRRADVVSPGQLEDYYRSPRLQQDRQSARKHQLECTPQENVKRRTILDRRISASTSAIEMTGRLNAISVIQLCSAPALYALVVRFKAPADWSTKVASAEASGQERATG